MLHVHRAERADRLADGLAETLLEPLEDPFEPDIVAVPTKGIERWLAQRLSTRLGTTPGRRDGVCANVEFPFPGRLITRALAAATDIELDDDPWLPGKSVWPLLETVDECLDQPWLEILATHLNGSRGDETDATRRFGVVRHIADLFDRYAVHRPAMVRSWAAGAGDAPPDAIWQAELWRRLRERITEPSPAERLETTCEELRQQPELLDLPRRLSLFGLTRIPRSYLDVLAAIAQHRDVHLFVLHPSPLLWEHVRHTIQQSPPSSRRADDSTQDLPKNRLLGSWGRDCRELQLVLAADADTADHHHPLEPEEPRTLLTRIQADVRNDIQPPGAPLPGHPDERPTLDGQDRTIQIHACHGRARQVEVLRDAILHLLNDDRTLEPRDVIVMCPDIETFAPLIHATFGAAGEAEPPDDDDDTELKKQRMPDLRVRLADRALRQTNPVLGAVSQVLALADRRATASQLLDLADREPVRRCFRFDDDDVARMQDWVADSGIRWGFDAVHRKPFKLDKLDANTWRAGLDRILVGVMVTEEDRRLIGGVLPLDDVGSAAIDLAGRLAEYVDRAQAAFDALRKPQRIEGFAAAIADAADALTATSERESWQRAELQRVLDDVIAEARRVTGEASNATLELADIRALLADRLRGRPTRANFRTGHLTICTLVPMRSVPHRVVCVLGLDDGEFPRKARRDGDNLMLRDPHVGDRDARAEDRQMMLDALMAATERLVITYTGADERTNLPRPPAVPVGELLDTIDRTVAHPDGPTREARDAVRVHHPLQPFDERNFVTGKLVSERTWSFDRVSLAGARAVGGPRTDSPAFLAGELPLTDEPVIELSRLVRFLEHPVRFFLRDRLGIRTSEYLGEVDDSIAVELDGLGQWQVGQHLLEGVLEGAELAACMRAERVRGTLPPEKLGQPILDKAERVVTQIVSAIDDNAPGMPASLNVHVTLPDGCIVAGTVPGVRGDTLCAVSYSKLKAKERLTAWARLLALTAADPERPFAAVVIGRAHSRFKSCSIARIPPFEGRPEARRELALKHLATLVDLYRRGAREPLPIACETSAAYAASAQEGLDGAAEATKAWHTGFGGFGKEDQDPEHVLVYGEAFPFKQLLADPPRADERGEGWEQADTSRFGRYARRLWSPLLSSEVVSQR
jgi:exodeoxyribonuclease V gamma subunit